MKRIYFILLVVASVSLLHSCKKDEALPSDQNASVEGNGKGIQPQAYAYNGVNYYYYKDNRALNMARFIPDTTGSTFLLVTGTPGTDSNFTDIYIREFSTEALYVDYGRNNGMKLKEILDFEKGMQDYISKNNIENYYRIHDTLPDSYYAFEDGLYNKYFGSMTRDKFIPGVTMHKNYWGGSPAWHVFSTMPYMFGWNNTLSATFPTYFYGFHSIYNKSWYRKRLATFYGFGWSFYRFVGPLGFLNDKTSSIIST